IPIDSRPFQGAPKLEEGRKHANLARSGGRRRTVKGREQDIGCPDDRVPTPVPEIDTGLEHASL
ncbi:MAG: hypothetical protein JWQ23_2852, partial [Herminiimonas sp.]|nr:hypothetical protein [Herminiimonas sp.]